MLGGEATPTWEAEGTSCFGLVGASGTWLAGLEAIGRVGTWGALTCNEPGPGSDGTAIPGGAQLVDRGVDTARHGQEPGPALGGPCPPEPTLHGLFPGHLHTW